MTENHGVPGSNPGPATLESADLQVKRTLVRSEARPVHHNCTTSRSSWEAPEAISDVPLPSIGSSLLRRRPPRGRSLRAAPPRYHRDLIPEPRDQQEHRKRRGSRGGRSVSSTTPSGTNGVTSTRMLEIAKDKARESGCQEASLLLFEQNEQGVVKLSESNGFGIIGRTPVVPHEQIR